ncbi:MAG: VanZ family protein [Burkholderiales bacterium]|nr:VanZ family protein [Burkholderiales bacterium]
MNAARTRRIDAARLAVICALCVAYGSLLPLDYQPVTLADALARFREIPYLRLGAYARADWIANIVLYIPLGYLLRAALRTDSRIGSVAGDAATFALCALLAVGLEFIQQSFPPRTVSLNDLLAEGIGSAIGIAAWRLAGARFDALWARAAHPEAGRAAAALTLYLIAYLALSLYPYDFMVSPSEFEIRQALGRDAWFIDRENCGSLPLCMIRLGMEGLIAVPIGLWLRLRLRATWGGAFAFALAFGVGIELLQLWIFSGTTTGASALLRTAGIVAGFAVGPSLSEVPWHRWQRARAPLALVAALPYVVLVAYASGALGGPRTGPAGGLDKLATLHFLPFYYHYFTSEANAVRSVLGQLALYAPAGVLVWAIAGGRSRGSMVAASVLAGGLALLVEGAKLFVAPLRPDPTNVLIAAIIAPVTLALVAAFIHNGSAPAAPARDRAPTPPPRPVVGRPPTWRKFAGALLLVAAAVSVWCYPLAPAVIAGLLVAAAGISWVRPTWGLALVLAALPVFNLAPWSGRFLYDEFDMLVLTVTGISFLRLAPTAAARRLVPGGRLALALFTGSWIVSLILGLWPFPELGLNAFSSYWSPYNALRIGKSLLWAFLLLPLVAADAHGRAYPPALSVGIVSGLAGTVAVALWERILFSGPFNFDSEYRITGMFFGMHTGGGMVEGYLVSAIPFLLAAVGAFRRGGAPVVAVAAMVFCGAIYALLVTFARGGYLGFAVSLAVLGAAWTIQLATSHRRALKLGGLTTLGVLLVGAAVALPILFGDYVRFRFSTVSQDFDTRLHHWRDALEIRSPGLVPGLFGDGLGTFPRTYLARNRSGVMPTTYSFVGENGGTFLRLGSGETLYFGQRIPIQGERFYTISVDVRAPDGPATITVPVCEKSILYSFRCVWAQLHGEANRPDWQHLTYRFNSGEVGSGRRFEQRPTELAFYHPDQGTRIDVDNVSLKDDTGRELVVNGSFSAGMDRWFFATDSHLPWHTKNVVVQSLFETGWVGLASLGLLLSTALLVLARRVLRGEGFAAVVLAALLALFTVGLFDALFDEPRLGLMLFLFVLLGLLREPPAAAAGRVLPSASPGRK